MKPKLGKSKEQRSCTNIFDTCFLRKGSACKNWSPKDANWDEVLHAYSLCELLRGKIYAQPSGNNNAVLFGASCCGATREKAPQFQECGTGGLTCCVRRKFTELCGRCQLLFYHLLSFAFNFGFCLCHVSREKGETRRKGTNLHASDVDEASVCFPLLFCAFHFPSPK